MTPQLLSAETLIERFALEPHPEGGHYRETYRSSDDVNTDRGPRPASTAILFLLAAGECSAWHRIRSDEAWHHHAGGPLLIHELSPDGQTRSSRLGLDLAAGDTPQHVVPAGSWFAAEPIGDAAWSLVSCTVAPGFMFEDFELANPEQLLEHQQALSRICPHWRKLCSRS